MISIAGSLVPCCEGATRREWLRIGGLSVPGLGLPELWAARQAQATTPLDHSAGWGRAKNCIVMFLFGAPAHQDTWDMKPDAPAEVRGEFRPMATTVPGIRICEHLPRMARQAHHLAIVRSMTHPDNTHTVAMHYMLTGVRHSAPNTNPRNQPTDFPTFGAVVNYLRRDLGQPGMPAAISLNAPANQVSAGNFVFPGFFAGFLGSANDPLFVSDDPSAPEFRPFAGAGDAEQVVVRRSLLAEVDRQADGLNQWAGVRRFGRHQQRAIELVTSRAAREACDLSRELPQVRDCYGRSSFGQGLLLARRLIEAGVSLVTVNWARDDAFWDTHKDNFADLKTKLLPPFDAGFSALIEDLGQRGLLDETLVVCLAEFGRTPRVNAAAGRDHWAPCFSVLLAGAGIRGGSVYGASDRIAAYPTDKPVSPSDLAATLYSTLGIDPRIEIPDRMGRSHRLAAGRALQELF
jgi:hypothetical protein